MKSYAYEICAQEALVYKRLCKEENRRREEAIEAMKTAKAEIVAMFASAKGVNNELSVA